VNRATTQLQECLRTRGGTDLSLRRMAAISSSDTPME
jgi:hypothetical protein